MIEIYRGFRFRGLDLCRVSVILVLIFSVSHSRCVIKRLFCCLPCQFFDLFFIFDSFFSTMPVRASARIRAANHQAQLQLHNILGAVNAAVGNIDGVIQHVGADLRAARRQEQVTKNRFHRMYLAWKARYTAARGQCNALKDVLRAHNIPIPAHLAVTP